MTQHLKLPKVQLVWEFGDHGGVKMNGGKAASVARGQIWSESRPTPLKEETPRFKCTLCQDALSVWRY